MTLFHIESRPLAHRKHLSLDIIWDVLESRALGNSKLLGYILNKLDSETTVFRNLQAPSSALAALGTLQPGAFRFLNPVDSSVSLSNYYIDSNARERDWKRDHVRPLATIESQEIILATDRFLLWKLFLPAEAILGPVFNFLWNKTPLLIGT